MKRSPRWRFSWLWALSYLDVLILSAFMLAGFVVGAFDKLIGRANPRRRLP